MNMWERGIFGKEVVRNQRVICCFGLHNLLCFGHPPPTKYPSGLYKETTKWEIFVFIKGRAAWQLIHAYQIWKINTHCISMPFENTCFLHTSGMSFLIDWFIYLFHEASNKFYNKLFYRTSSYFKCICTVLIHWLPAEALASKIELSSKGLKTAQYWLKSSLWVSAWIFQSLHYFWYLCILNVRTVLKFKHSLLLPN